MASWSRKRSFHNHNRRENDTLKRSRSEPTIYDIMTRVQSQKGIRGHLVLVQSSTDTPYSILHSAADRINAVTAIRKIENPDGTTNYQFVLNNEVLAEDQYISESVARKPLAELALANLTKSCFTIIRKVQLRDSPKVDLVPSNVTSTSTKVSLPQVAPSVGGIGAKLMLQMGWSGGGLGAKEQGRIDIVQPYVQIQRQGLGTKNIVQAVTNVLKEYADSKDINSIAFSPDFTKEERIVIHEVARRLNLKSRSYGKKADRLLVVQSKVKPWDLVSSLLEVGGESEQLKLILPTDFDHK